MSLAPARRRSPERLALGFTTVVAASALLLQRFGVPAGSKSINVVGFIGLGAAVALLLQGALSFSRARLAMFLLLAACAVCGLIYHAGNPGRFAGDPSLQSLLQFMAMSGFSTFTFTRPVGERAFCRVLTFWLGVVAAAGLLQFALQFAGLKLFSFRGIVPAALLFEDGYNTTIFAGIGSLLKSNGFFLLEPSIFSQFMALAIVIEQLTARRPAMLALFLAALMASMSGTGWIVLAAFLISAVFSMGARGAVLAAATAALAAMLLVGVYFAAPEVIASVGERMGEIARPSTSGHLRFVTPFWVLDDVLSADPASALAGLGGGVSEKLTLPYEYNVNTPVKIGIEYGFPALLAYLGLLTLGAKSPVQRALIGPGLAMLLFTGAYQQFPPVLFFVLLTVSVARLEPEPTREASAARARAEALA